MPDPEPVPAAPTRARSLLTALLPEVAPLDLRILGRTLLHAAAVGAAAGAVGALFFGGLEVVQRFLLEIIAGYKPLRAHGETFLPEMAARPFRWWLLPALPALGALVGGILTARFATEARGGGGDAAIEAFHQRHGDIRPRVIWVKALASIFTLGSGGSGGREGPTMHIGAALGSLVGRTLKTTVRERQVLLVAGIAAGIAAVFRTPLGAALLAAEVLYRDDFESDALIPAVLASVVAYSVVISVFGESTLFAHAPRYQFVPVHLPLYGLLAVLIALLAIAFVKTLRLVQRVTAKLPVPVWARPACGGLALGLFATPVVMIVGHYVGTPGQGLGVMGGGYGAAQLAITGGPWIDGGGWRAVEILLLLCFAKVMAASLTIGSGGSAGDFAPSLVLGGLFGGAFGRVVALILHDPRIDPGAFALVGMGTFYGGIAHVPLSSLVLVCELAGSYDLLVPLMLAEGVAFVVLRRHSLYPAQLPSRREAAGHVEALALDALRAMRVREIMVTGRPFVAFEPKTPAGEVMRRVSDVPGQDVFPVIAGDPSRLIGLITAERLRILGGAPEMVAVTIAADVMQPPITVRLEDNVRTATQTLLENGLPEVPVVDDDGRIGGFLGESEIAQAYLRATSRSRSGQSGELPAQSAARPPK
jgi:chloride channel protein, CIC family